MQRFALMLLVACSASPPMAELTTAEQRAATGDTDGAVAAYRIAQNKCQTLQPPRRARQACSEALLGEAETLEHADRVPAAIAAYLAIPAKSSDDATAAIATLRAAELFRRSGNKSAAETALWNVITTWPSEAPASDAIRALVNDRTDAKALSERFAALRVSLAVPAIDDNLAWALAELAEQDLEGLAAARGYYDQIYEQHAKSGLRDDARWHAARLSRLLGDAPGAVQRLRGLLGTREVAFGAGSYFSIWLDDAQLELGKVLRDDVKDLPAAIAAFEKLPKDYPASILRDDALYELAVTLERAGDHGKACATLAKLAKDSPDSKYLRRTDVRCE